MRPNQFTRRSLAGFRRAGANGTALALALCLLIACLPEPSVGPAPSVAPPRPPVSTLTVAGTSPGITTTGTASRPRVMTTQPLASDTTAPPTEQAASGQSTLPAARPSQAPTALAITSTMGASTSIAHGVTPVPTAQAPTSTVRPPASSPLPPTDQRGALTAGPPPLGAAWEVATLLVAPGEPGRLYALVKQGAGPLWAFPSDAVRLMISDDYAAHWSPFPGGLPVAPDCMINVNLDYATPDGLYASTCAGLYAWDGNTWVKRSDRVVDVVAVAYHPAANGSLDARELWAAERAKGVIHSQDGGLTWQDASAGLVTFGGLANLGIDPRDNSTLYGIIRPKYAGSYLRRLTAGGQWQTMPTPENNITIETGMTIDGSTGALYVTTQIAPYRLWRSPNPSVTDLGRVAWQMVHDFGPDASVDILASGWSPQGLALYANIWPLTPLPGGGASVGNPVLYRSPDGGQTWQPLATP